MNEIDLICEKLGGTHTGRNRDTGAQNWGGDMSKLGYTIPYEKYFSSLKNEKISLLEIGIFRGGGLAVWSSYFSNGKIYGADIGIKEFNANKALWKKIDNKIFDNLIDLYEIDSRNSTIINDLNLPLFDIIIDDGKHTPEAQYSTFCNFFPNLNPGGIYVIEDITKGNRYSQLKSLLDNHNKEYNSLETFDAHDNKNHIIFIQK